MSVYNVGDLAASGSVSGLGVGSNKATDAFALSVRTPITLKLALEDCGRSLEETVSRCTLRTFEWVSSCALLHKPRTA